MKFQILFARKNKKNIINFSSADFAQRLIFGCFVGQPCEATKAVQRLSFVNALQPLV